MTPTRSWGELGGDLTPPWSGLGGGDKRDVRDATQDCLEGLSGKKETFSRDDCFLSPFSPFFRRRFQFFRGLGFGKREKPILGIGRQVESIT